MIKYIIDKGVDLECKTVWRQRPIHFICENSTPEMQKYMEQYIKIQISETNYHQ